MRLQVKMNGGAEKYQECLHNDDDGDDDDDIIKFTSMHNINTQKGSRRYQQSNGKREAPQHTVKWEGKVHQQQQLCQNKNKNM